MKLFYLFVFCLCFQVIHAQTPEITGDNMLCPEGTGQIMTTEEYDSYKWVYWYYGSEDTLSFPDTTRSITLNHYDHAATFFQVTVTSGDSTFTSEPFLVDGWSFLPVTVLSTGDYEVGPNGEFVLCPGDTIYFEIQLPYDTLITWTHDGAPITGENQRVLVVTQPGIYGVSGAPDICPNFIQQLGVELDVQTCEVNSTGKVNTAQFAIYPSVVKDALYIDNHSGISQQYRILNISGTVITRGTVEDGLNTIQLPDLEKGIYILQADKMVFRFIKTE